MGRLLRLLALGLGALVIAATATTAFTAGNTVSTSNAGESAQGIGPNSVKPPACAGLTLTNLVVGDGLVQGTNAADLVLGGAGADNVRGKAGADCLMAGGGDDDLHGGPAFDVCLGGAGTNQYKKCEVQIP